MEHLKAYVSLPLSVGLTPPVQLPIIEDQEEHEVEDILSHRKPGAKTEQLASLTNHGPEDDPWLPQTNLVNAPDILQE